MADLYGPNGHSSSLESEDMSSFLHNLLHNSSAGPSASPFPSFNGKHTHSFSSPPPPQVAMGEGEGEGIASTAGLFQRPAADSDCQFSDLGRFFASETKEARGTSFSSAGAADSGGSSSMKMNFPPEDDVSGDFDFGYEVHDKSLEMPGNPVAPRSSKRTRAAEIHNLSEKRRRSRINEKLKALQTLIPNSNKTDKASMLDEAIEYLKQLQLQVQMLTMRNGLSLQPAYLQETLQPIIQRGIEYDEGDRLINPNAGGIFPLNQEILLRREFDIPKYPLANPQINIQSMANITKSETPFGLEPSTEN